MAFSEKMIADQIFPLCHHPRQTLKKWVRLVIFRF